MLSILSQNIFSQFLAPFIIYLWVHNSANFFFKNYIMVPRVSTSSFLIFSYSSWKLMMPFSMGTGLERVGIAGPELAMSLG